MVNQMIRMLSSLEHILQLRDNVTSPNDHQCYTVASSILLIYVNIKKLNFMCISCDAAPLLSSI